MLTNDPNIANTTSNIANTTYTSCAVVHVVQQTGSSPEKGDCTVLGASPLFWCRCMRPY